MKKIDRLILKSFLGPLVLTFAIAVFVLLMQFVWKYIDDMVGKGLDFIIIAKLLFYASATFVPMALPISVLFASIMTMGNFGEKYELVAMKAGGVSLSRVMMPMAFVAILLTGIAFYFANNVMPAAMLQYRTILYDVTRKKPAVNIRPSEYYSEIDGYVIRINKKDPDGQTLREITIYDHTQGMAKTNVITAQRGIMQSSADDQYLVFTLYDGCYYNEQAQGDQRESRPFTRIDFEKEVMTFDISSFAFSESDEKFFEGSYQMMNVKQLKQAAMKLEEASEKRCLEQRQNVSEKTLTIGDKRCLPGEKTAAAKAGSSKSAKFKAEDLLQTLPPSQRVGIVAKARSDVQQLVDQTRMYDQIMQSDLEYTNRHYIELHRKFTLSVACLLLFLVGAPFGSIVRKGGLGMPLVASVVFFVLYYVIGMICEKAVREGALSPIGMWVSSFVLLPIGILLTIQATTDRNLILGEWLDNLRLWITQKIQSLKRKKVAEANPTAEQQ